MKHLILFLIVAPLLATAQPLMFEEVVYPGDSTETKDELYNRAKSWFVDAFKNPDKVIQNDDKEAGVIIGKGSTDFKQSFLSGTLATSGSLKFTVSIYVKEGRYKYVIGDFIHDAVGTRINGYNEYDFGLVTTDAGYPRPKFRTTSQTWCDRVWVEIQSTSRRKGNLIATSIKSHMAQPTEMEDDDW